MKKINLFLLPMLVIAFTIQSCKLDSEEADNLNDLDSQKTEIPAVKSGSFYADISKDNSIVLADTVIYYTVIKNSDPEDTWQEECLARLDRKALANIIFNAIYNGRLTPYDFMNEEPITIEEVKEIEKRNPRNAIARVEFTEEWYFNETDLNFIKRVNAIMLGYEKPNESGEMRYIAGVKVFLNGPKMKIEPEAK